MKLLFVSLFCLELTLLTTVSCETLIKALYKLINDVEAVKRTAYASILDQYSSVISETDQQLYHTIVPSINEAYANINSYIEGLEEQCSSLGDKYNSCVEDVDRILNEMPSAHYKVNVTAKALEEKNTCTTKSFTTFTRSENTN
ncbi:hypothetical protein NQ318_020814 [Aromia moschata]|uniref:Uncharacterized protein n=1 Tax=Aromia moschata TaxID=1265417 RepID=A0AAV8Y737_9CUCU|nr:hypothetical protein NQ318_020814 [Aromia moschata]